MASKFPSLAEWKKGLELGNIELTQAELKALYANAKAKHTEEFSLEGLYAKQLLKAVVPVRTIPGLNRLIRETLGDAALGDEAERTWQSTRRERGRDIPKLVGDYFPDCAGGAGAGGRPEACAWPIMNSDGDGNDCLIHSFLTATCPNFRRLALHHKRQFARSFRVDFLPKFPEIQQHFDTVDTEGVTGRERFMEERFLGDEDLQIIRRMFNVNIVVFQGQRKVGRVVNPAMVTSMIENPEDFKVYFIFNNGTNHFESIKPGDVYFLPIDAAAVSIEPFIRQAANETKPRCDYEEGETITYKGKRYTVLSRKWGDANKSGIVRCETLELLGEDGEYLPSVPVSELPRKRPHNNAAALTAMVAGPGPEYGVKRPHNVELPPSSGPIVGQPSRLFKTVVNHLVETKGVNTNTARKAVEEHTFGFLNPNAPYDSKESLIKVVEKALNKAKKGGGTRKQRKHVRQTRKA